MLSCHGQPGSYRCPEVGFEDIASDLRETPFSGQLPSSRQPSPKRLFNRETLVSDDLRRCTCSQTHESMAGMKSIRLGCILPAVMSAALLIGDVHALSGFPNSQVSANGS